MARWVGYCMFLVAVLSAVLAVVSASTMMSMLELGLIKPGAKLEVIVLVLGGVVIPIGIGTLLLKKH